MLVDNILLLSTTHGFPVEGKSLSMEMKNNWTD